MKNEHAIHLNQESMQLSQLEQQAEATLRDLEFQKEQAVQTEEELARKELEALLLRAQQKEAERNAELSADTIERQGGLSHE